MVQLIYDFPPTIFPLPFTLPVVPYGGYITSVDWGDSSGDTSTTTHTYNSAPTTPIIVTGNKLWINNYNGNIINPAAQYLILCDFTNDVAWLRQAFKGCSKLTTVPSTIPTGAADLSEMFCDAIVFNHQNISTWNVSHVATMNSMFRQASSFNQNIGGWDVSQVGNMANMFRDASSFNQYIGGWTVSHVATMTYMFYGASSFNQNISSWDVSHVSYMANMFNGASSFNQNIGGWNFTSVTDMLNMFDYSGLSINTYDEMLTSLSENPTILNNLTVSSTGITIGVKGLYYSNKSAHDFLESQNIFFDGDTYIPPAPHPISDVCFIKDTLVQTDQGKFPIQSLTKQTIHRMPITLTKTIHHDPYLVKIAANAFGAYPTKDTYMSLKHKVYLDKPIQAKHLINDDTVTLVPYNGDTLYNVLLDKHTTMRVHGMLVETLDPNCLIALFYKSKLSPKQKDTMILTINKEPEKALSILKKQASR